VIMHTYLAASTGINGVGMSSVIPLYVLYSDNAHISCSFYGDKWGRNVECDTSMCTVQ